MKKNRGNTNVTRELDRVASYKQFNASMVTDVSRLLESPEHKNKVRLMRELKWDQSLTRTETMLGDEKERSDLMAMFDHGSVSKLEEIKDVAVTYGLKFLPATTFKCPERYEMELVSLIAEFLKSKKIDYTDHSKNNFFVLADQRYFVERRMDIDDKVGVFVFYRPPKDKTNFLRVDHIGEGELSFWRYLKGWSAKNMTNAFLHYGLTMFFLTFPFFAFFGVGKAVVYSLLAASVGIFVTYKGAEMKGGYNMQTWDKDIKKD